MPVPPIRTAAVVALLSAATIACTSDHPRGPLMNQTASARETTVEVNGTTLHVERRGHGEPLLLIHGGGEDATMLADQATDLAEAGYHVITYDRRGTGGSGRDAWPGDGARQHAQDAAALLRALQATPATVVGVSSGAVVALTVAAQHPDVAARVVAWEPPAAGVVPGGAEITASIMEPVDRHLADHPGDFVGAQALLLSAITGEAVTVEDPAFAQTRRHAEAMVRDEPAITVEPFSRNDLAGRDITIGIGDAPNELVAGAVAELAALTGTTPVVVDAPHEVYLTDPAALTDLVTATSEARS